jgi:hypothetical protein
LDKPETFGITYKYIEKYFISSKGWLPLLLFRQQVTEQLIVAKTSAPITVSKIQ